MPSTWFIVKSDRELGPYTRAQMKQSAASGQLTTGDSVRRKGRLAAVVAGKVEGLFTDAQTPDRPKTTPPPLPSEKAQTTPAPACHLRGQDHAPPAAAIREGEDSHRRLPGTAPSPVEPEQT